MTDHIGDPPEDDRPDDEPDGDDRAAAYEWVDLFPVFDAPDELSAIHVRAMLQSAGIEARIRSAQVPWLDGVLANVVGYWGQVLVPRRDVLAARSLLSAYLEEVERGRSTRPDEGEDESGGGPTAMDEEKP